MTTAERAEPFTCTFFPVTGSRTPCGAPAVARIRYGCIHEHTGSGEACARCLKNRIRANEDSLTCTRCRNADGHICPMLITVEYLTAATP